MKIKLRLILAILCVSLVPLILSSTMFYLNEKNTITREVKKHLESAASLQSARLEAIVQQNIERIGLVSNRTQMRISLRDHLRNPQQEHQDMMIRILNDAQNTINSFQSITIYALDGSVIASTLPVPYEENVPLDEELLHRSRSEFSADTLLRKSGGELAILLGGPLLLDGELLGVMIIESDAANMISSVSNYTGLGETGEIVLARTEADSSAMFLLPTRFDPEAALKRVVPKEKFSCAIHTIPEDMTWATRELIDYRGVEVLAVSHRIHSLGWVLILKVDKSEAFIPVNQVRGLILLVVGILTLLIVLIAVLFARSITRPITDLTGVALNISKGDYSRQASVASANEFGVLSAAFNRMTTNLLETKEELEAKVQELHEENQERQSVESRLDDGEALLRSIFRASPTGIGLVVDRKLIWTNEMMTRISGYSRKEMAGRNARMMYPDDEEYERVGREKYRQIQEHGTGTVETKFLRKDGKIVDVLVSSTPLDVDNLSAGVTFTALDITDRKEAEAELRSSEEKYREIFNAPGDAIFIHDAETGAILDANRAVVDIFGYTPREVLHLEIGALSSGDAPYCQADAEKKILLAITRGPQAFPWLSKRKNGELFWSEVGLKFLELRNKKCVVAVVRDVHQRKMTEETVRRAKEEWEKTFDAITEIICIHDKEMNIVQANKAALPFCDFGPAGYGPKRCFEMFRSGDSGPCLGCPAILTLADGKEHSAVMNHGKSERVYQVSTSPIFDQEGEVEFVVRVSKDITEQKRLERDLIQAQKMEAVGTLAGGVAHDFNNILTGILGFAELASERVEEGEFPHDDLERVIGAALRARDLVSQILVFSRKGEVEKSPLNPHTIIDEPLNLMRAAVPTTIQIQEKIDKSCGPILSDPTQLHQIVVNLCTNAFHAMEKGGGELTVSLSEEDLKADDMANNERVAPGRFVVLEVRDTGIGMDSETLQRMFEPYFTTKEVGKGSGMGLAVIHGILQDHGGLIRVESTPGSGTVVRAYFPVSLEETDLKENAESRPLPGGSESILLVDDEDMIVCLQEEILGKLGYQITSKTSSLEALAEFKADPNRFDLVISDQTMPDLTGMELAKIFLELKPEVPIILCTGFSSQASAEKAKVIGISRFLMKPVTQGDLAETVRDCLDQDKQGCESKSGDLPLVGNSN